MIEATDLTTKDGGRSAQKGSMESTMMSSSQKSVWSGTGRHKSQVEQNMVDLHIEAEFSKCWN